MSFFLKNILRLEYIIIQLYVTLINKINIHLYSNQIHIYKNTYLQEYIIINIFYVKYIYVKLV